MAGRGRCSGTTSALAVVVLAFVAGCSARGASPEENAASTRAAATDSEGSALDVREHPFPLLLWSVAVVEQEYYAKERFEPVQQLVSSLEALGLQTPAFFAVVDREAQSVDVRAGSQHETFSLDGLDSLGDAALRLEEVLEFTRGALALEGEERRELEYAAINGFLSPLDPHTILLTPEEHTDLGVRTKGSFGGVGAQIRAEQRRIVIVRVLRDMPAEKAGMQTGDIVLAIDGQRTVNMSASEAQQLLRGPVGSPVAIKVRRGRDVLTLQIVRDVIHIESVVTARLDDGVGYMQITSFQEDTGADVATALRELSAGEGEQKELSALVVDLRANSGGLLSAASAVVDAFVAQGPLVTVRSALGRETQPASEDVALRPDVPVVVLVDEQSASAAEIVSGGLQALGRAVVLGRSSFGKGSVQMVRPSAPYGEELALKLTVAEYLVGDDRRIQTLGVIPDVELLPVELSMLPGFVRYYDEERFEGERERARVADLPSSRHEALSSEERKAPHRVRYLWDYALPEKAAAEQMRDPEIRLGQAIAAAMAKSGQSGAAVVPVEVVERLRSEEDGRITAALRRDRIDWSQPETSAGEAAVGLKAELARKQPVVAGEPFSVAVTVRNSGERALHRVHVVTSSVRDELDDIELLIGTLRPGASVRKKLPLHVMPWNLDYVDDLGIELHVGEPDAEPDAVASVTFEVGATARPVLAFDTWVVDDPKVAKNAPKRLADAVQNESEPFEVRGNGDGVLNPGEQVLLVVKADNEGAGDAPDVRAMLRNLSGRQALLEEGLAILGPVRAGGTGYGAFGLTVSPEAKVGVPFEVEILLGDTVFREAVTHKLALPVAATGAAFEREPVTISTPHDGARLYSGAHPRSPIAAELEGRVPLQALGRYGKWWMVASPQKSRRLFVPVDLEDLKVVDAEKLSSRPSGARAELDESKLPPAVDPPTIMVESYPRVTQAAALTLRGQAEDRGGVRDLVVLVQPAGHPASTRKIAYQAADSRDDRVLPFTAEVPLAFGSNRITIVARDRLDVERRFELFVYRDR